VRTIIEFAVFGAGLHLTALPYILASMGIVSPWGLVMVFVGPAMMFAALKVGRRS
jgi:hypothetical protein